MGVFLRQGHTQKSKELRKDLHRTGTIVAQWRWSYGMFPWMGDRVTAPRGIRPSLSSAVHAHKCIISKTFLLNTLLCIGNGLLVCDDDMRDWSNRVLPQVHCLFHVDEAGVFAELPVHVVGDPPFSVIGINHFPVRTERETQLWPMKPESTMEKMSFTEKRRNDRADFFHGYKQCKNK